MKYPLIIAFLAGAFVSCEHKETTVNPPDKTETTIINPPATPSTTEKKTEKETTITPGGTTTETKETIEKK